MPVVLVPKEHLLRDLSLPKDYSDESFDELCFQFGIELDDVTSQQEIHRRETGVLDTKTLSDEVLYKIEIPANRYDLLCFEGLSRALSVFLSKNPSKTFSTVPGTQEITVGPRAKEIRPFIVAAVLRGITFDSYSYNSFLEFQEKLHFTLCRRRTLVAIGTHDLDSVKGPFKYDGVPKENVKFMPLFQTKEYTGDELIALYKKDPRFSHYMNIIAGSPVFPIVSDANGVILSMPPVINGEHSKISLNTKNVLIECTGTDMNKTIQVLNTFVSNFAQYCTTPFQVETVKVINGDGKTEIFPNLALRQISVAVENIHRGVGCEIPINDICSLLSRMQLPTEVETQPAGGNKGTVKVSIPAFRTDVLHYCDVVEDVAIAYGYNNIPISMPKCVTVGKQQPINELTELLRLELAMSGYNELLSLVLTGRNNIFTDMRRPEIQALDRPAPAANSTAPNHTINAVTVLNPTTNEFEVARNSLAPGMLMTVSHQKTTALPIRLFEISDVVVRENNVNNKFYESPYNPSTSKTNVMHATKEVQYKTDVGFKNERRLCVCYVNQTGGFEVIHGILDRVMQVCGIMIKNPALAGIASTSSSTVSGSSYKFSKGIFTYEIKELAPGDIPDPYSKHDGESFFQGRVASVFINGSYVGLFGLIHPAVLKNFDIAVPATLLELNLELIVANVAATAAATAAGH